LFVVQVSVHPLSYKVIIRFKKLKLQVATESKSQKLRLAFCYNYTILFCVFVKIKRKSPASR
jgi:hypothetical protein